MYDLYDNDPSSGYANDDYEAKMEGFPEGEDDVDDGNGFAVSRKESRIPVAIRRLRTRGEKHDHGAADEDSTDWPVLDRELVVKREDRRRPRQHKSALTAVSKAGPLVVKSSTALEKRKVGPHVCPDCNRTFAVVNREGVYVAFSIGIMPLLMLLVFVVVLAIAPYCAPVVVRKLKKLPAIQERTPKAAKKPGFWGLLGYPGKK